jgi:3-methyladenine DNA glycosylase AlkD
MDKKRRINNKIRKYFSSLELSFQKHASAQNAVPMKKYMREQFDFFGVQSKLREQLYKEFIKEYDLPAIEDIEECIYYLWEKPQRDFQYIGMFLILRLIKNTDDNIIELLEFMISNKSWWDTVDYIASKIAGQYFTKYPEKVTPVTEKWIASGNMWLQRSVLLFQLKYKKNTDERLLFDYITRLAEHKDFFIRKAIGWALREYSKTNPKSVEKFIHSHKLSPLSVKEGMKVIDRKENIK